MSLRVVSDSEQIVIDIAEDTSAVVDTHGLRIVTESGVGRVVVCDLDWDHAHEFSKLLSQAVRTFA